jgi:hypothetical protein
MVNEMNKPKLLGWLEDEIHDNNPHIPETESSKAFVRALSLVHKYVRNGVFDNPKILSEQRIEVYREMHSDNEFVLELLCIIETFQNQ